MIIPIIIRLVNLAYDIYVLILFVRIVLSWTNPNPWNPLIKWIYKLTDPFLNFIRRMVPIQAGMFDFSPIIAVLLLSAIRWILVGLLTGLTV